MGNSQGNPPPGFSGGTPLGLFSRPGGFGWPIVASACGISIIANGPKNSNPKAKNTSMALPEIFIVRILVYYII